MGSGGWGGVPAPELAQLMQDTTGKFLAYVEALPPDTDDSATARFPMLGELTARGWLLLDAVHVAMHIKQIREMQSQPDYPRE
jgi:hypothetical protein